MTTLVIAEKPSVAGDLAKALGGFRKTAGYHERDDVIITYAVGHLVELDVPEAKTAARGFPGLPIIPETFGLRVIDRAAEQYRVIEKLLGRRDVQVVMNACDAGREGELIFRLILDMAGCQKPVKRMWCQSMTDESLREAYELARPGTEFDALHMAARSRSEADWLVGINASRALMSLREQQTGMMQSMSAGRVQTPTLAIMVDREDKIRSFVPQSYWELVAEFRVAAGMYKGKWKGVAAPIEGQTEEQAESSGSRLFDKGQALQLLESVKGQPVDSASEESTPTRSAPPTLFDLTTLQREANKRFKFSAKKTLEIAQALYERHKMTTYPRTDSSCLPEDYVATAQDVMRQLESSAWGQFAKPATDSGWVRPTKRIFDNAKISDHFAIIPTGVQSDQLGPEEKLLYELIVRRFIAAFYPDAEFIQTKRVTVIAGYPFYSAGKVMVNPGWTAIIREVTDDGKATTGADGGLCALGAGEVPENASVAAVEGATTPPKRFTDATLLAAMATAGQLVEDEEARAAMKDKGLGTPATRAATIETLLDSGSASKPKEPYVVRQANFLVPTDKGMNLVKFLRDCGTGFLTSAETTGEWEECLNRMARGEFSREDFMHAIRDTTRQLVEVMQDEARRMPAVAAKDLNAPCPQCKAPAISMPAAFQCSSACGWRQRREVATRPITDVEMAKLLRGEALKGLSGFYSSTKKKKFSAGLKFDGAELKLEFDDAPGAVLACKCPKCDGDIEAKAAVFACLECEFKVWREVCNRKFTDREMEQLLSTGTIKVLKGFVSKAKKKFDAGVKLNMDGKVDLVFE